MRLVIDMKTLQRDFSVLYRCLVDQKEKVQILGSQTLFAKLLLVYIQFESVFL